MGDNISRVGEPSVSGAGQKDAGDRRIEASQPGEPESKGAEKDRFDSKPPINPNDKDEKELQKLKKETSDLKDWHDTVRIKLAYTALIAALREKDTNATSIIDGLKKAPVLQNDKELAETNKRVKEVKLKLDELIEKLPGEAEQDKKGKEEIKQFFNLFFENISKFSKKDALNLLDTIDEIITGKEKEKGPVGETIKLSLSTSTSVKFNKKTGQFELQPGKETSKEIKKELEKINHVLQYVGKDKIEFKPDISVAVSKDKVILPGELQPKVWGLFRDAGLDIKFYIAGLGDGCLPETKLKEGADFPTKVLYIGEHFPEYKISYNENENKKQIVISYGTKVTTPVDTKGDIKTELRVGGKVFIPADEGVILVRQIDPKKAIIIPPVSKK